MIPRDCRALATVVVLLAAPALLGACRSSAIAPPPQPAAALPAPSGASEGVIEAREQSALAPQEPYWPYRLAELYVEADSTAAAAAALDTALARDPGYVPALALVSKLWFRAGRHADAVRLLETAWERPGAFPGGFPAELLAGLALHLDAMGESERSRGMVAAIPAAERARVAGALAYLGLRSADAGADRDIAAALERDGTSAPNLNNHGIARLRAGDPAGARAAFARAIERDPTLPGPYYNLAILEKYYRLDDGQAARWLALYRQRANTDPDRLVEAFGASEPAPANGEAP